MVQSKRQREFVPGDPMMADAATDPDSAVVTAAVLVIGDEILSGRTKDKNIGTIAEHLTGLGIDLKEVRVVPDDEAEIIAALNALRRRYSYVFTTGGIGPTHDDITADCVAKAFGVPLEFNAQAVEIMRARVAATGGVMNEARMRMTRIPAGATLLHNKISGAPGFRIGNVVVMAGIPAVMQAMLEDATPRLKTGKPVISESIRADCREGDIGTELGAIARQHAGVAIGSYPFQDENGVPNTNVVVRSRDPQKLAAAKSAIEAMLRQVKTALAKA
jgi:molybdenum cofactor synthesis domain-containing protein